MVSPRLVGLVGLLVVGVGVVGVCVLEGFPDV